MSPPPDYHLVLLQKARQDRDAADQLAVSGRIAIEVIGFHCQQAVEKSMKAVLEFRREPFPLTHDLMVLLGQLERLGLTCPVTSDDAATPNQFAVRFRYDMLPLTQPEPSLDPAGLARRAHEVVAWAESIIDRGG